MVLLLTGRQQTKKFSFYVTPFSFAIMAHRSRAIASLQALVKLCDA